MFRDSFWQGWGHSVSLGSATHPLLPQILGFSSYLIDTPKEGEELAEKGGTHAGNVHKGSLEVGVGGELGRDLSDLRLALSSKGLLYSPTCNYLFAKGHPTAQGTG